MKSYTDLEQSRKLADILPLESADMYYPWDIDSGAFLNIPIVKDDSYYLQGSIDCWSLAALLDVLPSVIVDSYDNRHFRVHCMKRFTEWYDNAIDACVAMIIKLKELNLL